MYDADLLALVASFNSKDPSIRDAVWQQLGELSERPLPLLEQLFHTAKLKDVRRDIAFHAIRHARTNESAFRIGLAAITDKSTIVRYRGCCVLAYSLRHDALPALQPLLRHPDAKTVDDAKAAIDAIESRNHHFFVDRQHSGRLLWEVNPTDRQ